MTMKFVYPVPKPNGDIYDDGNELLTQLQQEQAGQYGFNPGNSSWHGGLHVSLNNAPHCQKEHPIVAIADGKVVAYRMTEDYLTSVFKEVVLPYSGNFCLLQHDFPYTEDDQSKHFIFYSLYMHLAPLAEEQIAECVDAFQLPNWLYTEKSAEVTANGLRCRTDRLENAGFFVKKGQKFKYDPRQLESKVFNGTTRYFARCTLEPALSYGGSSITETWLCVDDDLVKTIDAKTVTEGALVELSDADQIDINGGDAIGYLGQFHIPTQIEADTPVVDPRYQIHFELFSIEEPPEAFLKRFFGEANLAKVKKVEGDGSDGYLDRDEPNDFFKDFYKAVTLDESDVPGTEIAKNLSKWDSAQYMYHKHASEWYDTAADKPIWETLLGKFTSPNFEALIEHEKERVDNLVWMQDASGLGLSKDVWNWWPIHSFDDEMDTRWLSVDVGSLTFDSEGTDIESSFMFTRTPHVPNNSGIVIGESGITIGRGFDIGKRSASEVEQYFATAAENCKPIGAELLTWLKGGAGKTKQAAYDYYLTLERDVPEEQRVITRKMQHFLFLAVYAYYQREAKRITTKPTVNDKYLNGNQINWDALPDNVKAVIVDLLFVGHYTGLEDSRGNTRERIVPAVYKDQQEGLSGEESYFYEVMTDPSLWQVKFSITGTRFENRWKCLI